MVLKFVVFALYGVFAATMRSQVITRPKVMAWLGAPSRPRMCLSPADSPSNPDDRRCASPTIRPCAPRSPSAPSRPCESTVSPPHPSTQYRCASEAMPRCLKKGGELPSIHPLGDFGDATSVAYSIPIAVFVLAT